MIEGAFQLILSIFVPIWKNPFEGFKDEKIKNNKTLFIILFILYVLLQIVVNIYRIYCNVIYSPMARSLIDYFMNPFLNIFFFFVEKDFFDNVVYFVVSEILCCVMSFFGCVFNEYIVLYCCGLERETKDEIVIEQQFLKVKKALINVNYNLFLIMIMIMKSLMRMIIISTIRILL